MTRYLSKIISDVLFYHNANRIKIVISVIPYIITQVVFSKRLYASQILIILLIISISCWCLNVVLLIK